MVVCKLSEERFKEGGRLVVLNKRLGKIRIDKWLLEMNGDFEKDSFSVVLGVNVRLVWVWENGRRGGGDGECR